MSIYNSQSPFNQGAKRSEITAANKQRRQSRRQRVKDIKEAGGPEFYSADGYHVGEFDKKGRNIQYPEKRYSKKNPPQSPMNQGDIKQAPSKLTQAYRRFKNDESGPYNMARNLATAAVALAPLPIGKINAVKKVGKAINNIVKSKKTIPGGGGTYGKPNASNLKGTGPSRGGNFNEIIGPLGKGLNKSNSRTTSIPNPIPASTKTYNKLQYPMGKKAFSRTPKSKPVDYMGPNPAHKTGAGGNSYPK